MHLLKFSWWSNINTSAPYAWSFSLGLAVIQAPLVLTLAAFFVGFGNLVHRWSHERANSRPKIVTLLQRIGLFASPSHHAGHHFKRGKIVSRENARVRYCVMTDWLNPILDRVRFFSALEFIFRGAKSTR